MYFEIVFENVIVIVFENVFYKRINVFFQSHF